MRIIGEIPHPNMKITIFKMNDKVSVKFEDGQIEHIIKFRPFGMVNNSEEAMAFFTDEMIKRIHQSLLESQKLVSVRQSNLEESNDFEFPEII